MISSRTTQAYYTDCRATQDALTGLARQYERAARKGAAAGEAPRANAPVFGLGEMLPGVLAFARSVLCSADASSLEGAARLRDAAVGLMGGVGDGTPNIRPNELRYTVDVAEARKIGVMRCADPLCSSLICLGNTVELCEDGSVTVHLSHHKTERTAGPRHFTAAAGSTTAEVRPRSVGAFFCGEKRVPAPAGAERCDFAERACSSGGGACWGALRAGVPEERRSCFCLPHCDGGALPGGRRLLRRYKPDV